METLLEKTSKRDQKIAKALISKVSEVASEISKSNAEVVSIKIGEYKKNLEIPKTAALFFLEILNRMAIGNSFALLLSENKDELTTQQAADILGVSRPYIINLLEKGEIPFHKIGTHRRIQMGDLIKYDKKIKKGRAEKLDFLATQAQELNLGY